jgi:hypothetical protein
VRDGAGSDAPRRTGARATNLLRRAWPDVRQVVVYDRNFLDFGFELRRPPELGASICFSIPARSSDIVIPSPVEMVITVSIVRLCSPRSMPPIYVRCSPQ